MQAVVKTPHIRIQIKGTIPSRLLNLLRDEYGKKVKLIADPENEKVDIFTTEWYRKTKAEMTPGFSLKVYRQNWKMTQTELGKKLGGVPKQHISNMENGTRPISKKMAISLSKIFHVSVERFIG
jgi:DNA-binding XRE family transcriptional regulator